MRLAYHDHQYAISGYFPPHKNARMFVLQCFYFVSTKYLFFSMKENFSRVDI